MDDLAAEHTELVWRGLQATVRPGELVPACLRCVDELGTMASARTLVLLDAATHLVEATLTADRVDGGWELVGLEGTCCMLFVTRAPQGQLPAPPAALIEHGEELLPMGHRATCIAL